MIAIEALRQRIDDALAWSDLCDALGARCDPQESRGTAATWEIQDAFGPASVNSERLRKKLHPYALPDLDDGRYSDISMIYHLQSGLSNALEIGRYAARFGATDRRLSI